jgi:polar amino acid transport system substrate-binding protein
MTRARTGAIGWGGIAVLVGLGALVGGWFLLRGEPGGDPMARVRAGGPIRIGYANEDPYGYLDADTGRVTGEAPEIARVILARMGVKRIEPVVARFGELIPALKAGRLDVVAAGMYVTPARCEEIAFSDPTYRIGEGFIVRRGNPLDLHAYEDVVAHPKARLGVMGGAVEQGYAQKLGVPDGRIVLFEDYPTALVGLKAGRIDALGATTLTITRLLQKAGDETMERAQPFRDPVIDGKRVEGFGAFGFRKRDRAFRDAFNRELRAFVGTPQHLKLVRPFGFSKATLPGDVTAASLCGAGH